MSRGMQMVKMVHARSEQESIQSSADKMHNEKICNIKGAMTGISTTFTSICEHEASGETGDDEHNERVVERTNQLIGIHGNTKYQRLSDEYTLSQINTSTNSNDHQRATSSHVINDIFNDNYAYSTGESSDEYVPSEQDETSEDIESDDFSYRNMKEVNLIKKDLFRGNEVSNSDHGDAESVKRNCQPKKKMFEIKEKVSRKRIRKPDTWKKNKAALARNSGESYLSYKGMMVPPKSVKLGTLCTENCRLNCSEKFDEDARHNIFNRYYKLDVNSKNVLLFKSILIQPVQRHRVGSIKNKKYSFKYIVTYGQKQIPCCKRALCSLYQFSNKKIDIIQQKVKAGESAPTPDKRGKHKSRPHKITENVVEHIVKHIKKFPSEASHYSRNRNPHKMYLSPLLNINRMYDLYVEECNIGKLPEMFYIAKCSYRNIFETHFNLAFGVPKSDTCSTCDAGKNSEEHKENYKLAFAQQKRDREMASKVKKTMYLTMDLQQTMPLPKLSTSKAFYLRQMWFYNFGIHTVHSSGNKAFFFTWTEDVAKRGNTEIASCLHTFSQIYNEHIGEEIDHLIIWSDSCAGQNKNFKIITLTNF